MYNILYIAECILYKGHSCPLQCIVGHCHRSGREVDRCTMYLAQCISAQLTLLDIVTGGQVDTAMDSTGQCPD